MWSHVKSLRSGAVGSRVDVQKESWGGGVSLYLRTLGDRRYQPFLSLAQVLRVTFKSDLFCKGPGSEPREGWVGQEEDWPRTWVPRSTQGWL